ncbi:SDR family oxidoreductase [Nocardioides sp. NPDC051685]|uniref:SDR family oxidoreductase n=1 Tax=Nocardioides sp. NPDC051685 TaxID=3364334 RepID=UPI0037AF6709
MGTIEYSNAVAVVTGGGDGIGRSIVLSLAARGATVVVADIREEAATSVAREAVDRGARSLPVAVDVSRSDQVEAMADLTFDTFGKVDILVNNAGVTTRPFCALWNASQDDLEFVIDVNLYGVVNGLRAFLPRMRTQSGRRHIVNTSSFATLYDTPGHSMYTASKAAVNGLSDVLREEFVDQGDDIGMTVLFPGRVTTDIGTTSAGLRPRRGSADREVIPYEIKRRFDQEFHEPLPPDRVGEMLLRAIEAGASYCVTHPATVDAMRRKVDEIAAGYFPTD